MTLAIRPLRGRAFVHIGKLTGRTTRSGLILPDEDAREQTSHRGRVLALGAPALTPRRFDGERWVGGAEVPWGCAVGDEVVFVLAVWLDKQRVLDSFPGIEGDVCAVAQEELLGVVRQE